MFPCAETAHSFPTPQARGANSAECSVGARAKTTTTRIKASHTAKRLRAP